MISDFNCFKKISILNSLKFILERYPSLFALHTAFKESLDEGEIFSYSQFNRYIRGKRSIPVTKESIIMRFLCKNLALSDFIAPYVNVNINGTPIHLDLWNLLNFPKRINLLAFHVIFREQFQERFDCILTHSEAIPIAIAFSQQLGIPWISLTFQNPGFTNRRVSQYPYFRDQELINTAYFIENEDLSGKRLLLIHDYIRKGHFTNLLLDIAEEQGAKIEFLLALLGVGDEWKSFKPALEGNFRVLYLV